MNQSAKNLSKNLRSILLCLSCLIALSAFSCKKTDKSEGIDIFGPSDETAEAAQIVAEANKDLTKIKVLYKQSNGMLEELKNAMKENNSEQVRKISNEVVQLINDGTGSGKDAIEKIKKAQEMKINEEYSRYLSLKEDSLMGQLKAFGNYHQAALSLRDNYDPKNKLLRQKMDEEFKNHSENYRIIMKKARDDSRRANELAKEAQKAQSNEER